MLLPITYISRIPKKDENGNKIPHPVEDGEYVMDERELEEAIDVDRIKAVRPFHGKKYQTKKPITVVYLKPDSFKEKAKEMHVLAEYKDFVTQVNEFKCGIREEEKAT